VRSSVVIVNWNAGQALAACASSLATDARAGCEVIVVDNASDDGSTAAAVAAHPWLTVVRAATNLGFAAGANLGADRARGDAIVFLNPDARVLPGALPALIGALAVAPHAGIAGGGLVSPDGRWQPGAARFGPVGHLMLDTTLGGLAPGWRQLPTSWTGSARRRGASSFTASAASTRRTSSTARTWICASGRRSSARARCTCRQPGRCTART
jgi:GT2 family glycosyltransferase